MTAFPQAIVSHYRTGKLAASRPVRVEDDGGALLATVHSGVYGQVAPYEVDTDRAYTWLATTIDGEKTRQIHWATNAAEILAEGAADAIGQSVPDGFVQVSPETMVPARDGQPIEGAVPITIPKGEKGERGSAGPPGPEYDDLDQAIAVEIGTPGSHSGAWVSNTIGDAVEKGARRFTPTLGASGNWLTPTQPRGARPTAYIDMDIERLSAMGVETIQYICHVVVNAQGGLYVAEGAENFTYAATKAAEYGMTVNAIKFHFSGGLPDITAYGAAQWRDDYRALIVEYCELAQGIATYFTVLNEIADVYFNPSWSTYVGDLLGTVRSYGFKTGVTFSIADGISVFDSDKEWLVDESDIVFLNRYPSVSFMKEKATRRDAIQAFESDASVLRYVRHHTDKPIIISEIGVKDHWEALAAPERWGMDQIITPTPANGKAAELFLYGLFESTWSQYVDEVWLWYSYTMHHPPVYDLIRRYVHGGVER